MEKITAHMTESVASGDLPGGVLAAANADGSFSYLKAFGKLNHDNRDPFDPTEHTFPLASLTKLLTSIAVLQCIERGLIKLDSDVEDILPELQRLPLLEAMVDGKPVLSPRRNRITLRHLVTHTSGLCYAQMTPILGEYNDSLGVPRMQPPPTHIVKDFSPPAIFEPGTKWQYSIGLDWAGLLVERLTNMRLSKYIDQHIYKPLGILDICFNPDAVRRVDVRLAKTWLRNPGAAANPAAPKMIPFPGPLPVSGAVEDLGGQGCYGSAPEYLKVLQSILKDDGKILSNASISMMFSPSLPAEAQPALQANYDACPTQGPTAIGNFPPKVPYDWGVGGLLTLADVANPDGKIWRRKGTLCWSGMFNCSWFIDRTAGVCGIYCSSILPPAEPPSNAAIKLFEQCVYEAAAK